MAPPSLMLQGNGRILLLKNGAEGMIKIGDGLTEPKHVMTEIPINQDFLGRKK